MLKYLLIFIPLFSQAQITLFGELKNSNLRQVDITVIKSSGSTENINTFDREYKLNLDYGFVYDIQFKKSGYLTKTVRIDTRNIPFEDRRGGFEIELDGKLLKRKEGLNPDIEKTISNFASYDHEVKNFIFDNGTSSKYNDLLKVEKEEDKSPQKNQPKREDVTEMVYYLDNRKITERKVNKGKWIDVYTKVESKYFTFYFKNDIDITQEIWKLDTE
jgi:hypothetical protein